MTIQIDSLVKCHGEQQVLNIDSHLFATGSLTAIIGENGNGKSTLLNILAGLDHNYTGQLYYDGLSADHQMIDIGFAMQRPVMLRRSVFENIAYPLKIRGGDRTAIKRRVHTVANDFQIAHLLTKRAINLSAGETQRVSIARALAAEPKLFLLDEPTATIDVKATRVIETILHRYREQKRSTMIVVTHDIEQARRLGASILYLHKGDFCEVL